MSVFLHANQGRSQGSPQQMLFKVFGLNFSWDMPKMHYFSNNFSKIAKRWGLTAPVSLNPQYWWPEVRWFDQIVVFQADGVKIELPKISYDVIFVTSSPLHQPNDVTKITSQKFSILAPSSIKISGYASDTNVIRLPSWTQTQIQSHRLA